MIPQLLEAQPFAQAQLGNHVGYQNLIGFGVRTEPSRQLNSCPEKIVLALDRLTGRDANSDPERIFPCIPPDIWPERPESGPRSEPRRLPKQRRP